MLPVLVGVGVMVFAALTYAHFSGDERVRRTLRKTPVMAIKDMADGVHGKIVGRARAGAELLTAPVTGRACIAYAVSVVPQDQGTRAIRESKAAPFVVEDDSGRALIDPANAQLAIHGGESTKAGTVEDLPAMLLDRHGTPGSYTARVLVRETVLVEGERIAVLGSGTREPDPDAPPTAAYRGDAPTRLRLTSSTKYPLVISDDRKASS